MRFTREQILHHIRTMDFKTLRDVDAGRYQVNVKTCPRCKGAGCIPKEKKKS